MALCRTGLDDAFGGWVERLQGCVDGLRMRTPQR
jgi:hypothetical protein